MRLAPSETSAVSFVTSAQDVRGHWNGSGRYVDGGAARDREMRFELRAMTRVMRPLSIGVVLPYVRTERAFAGSSSAGAGVGDITLLTRYDLVRVGGQNGLPGLALTFAANAPTGRSPDRARDPLGSDVTGVGTWELKPGFALEKAWWTGWYVAGGASLGFFAPYRHADGSSVNLGPRFQAFVAGGKSVPSGVGLALGATHEREGAPRADGLRVGASRARTSALAIVSYEFDDHWQISASMLVDLFGREQVAGTTFGLGLRRAWNVY
jgi:hypothetical protein